MAEVLDLVDRAARDPEFLQRLQADPYGTARAEGVDVSHGALSELLGMPGASESQVAEALQSRLSYSSKGDPSGGQLGGQAQAGSLGIPTA
jgi:hypothetical protein